MNGTIVALTMLLMHVFTAHAAERPPRVETPEGKAPGDAVVVFDGTGKDALVNVEGQELDLSLIHI